MTIYSLNNVLPTCPDHADFWVAPGAHVIGNVSIGRAVSIWFGAVIRGDNEPVVLGDGTNVQDNAVLHTDPGFPLQIGSLCTIGHSAIVHGCTIGDRSLVGMGAVVLTGAAVERNCLVGAKALVPEGARIPECSLVLGVPGRVVRKLSPDEVSGLDRAAHHYQSRYQLYRNSLNESDPAA